MTVFLIYFFKKEQNFVYSTVFILYYVDCVKSGFQILRNGIRLYLYFCVVKCFFLFFYCFRYREMGIK